MLKEATCFKHIYLAVGRTDLRRGIDGLAAIIKSQYGLDPFQPDTLFLFCGNRLDRIKGLVYEEDGFLLLYKRWSDGHIQWPRSAEEARALTQEEFHMLMDGFSIEKTIKKSTPKHL